MVRFQYLEVSIAARANHGRCGVYGASWAFVGIPWLASRQMIISILGDMEVSAAGLTLYLSQQHWH